MNKIEKTCTRLAFNLFSPQKSDKSIIQQIENRLLGSHVNPVASRTGPKLLSRGAEKILVLCDSSVQQNTGSTNKSLTSQDMRPSQYYKKYKLSLDQKDIKKKKNKTHTHTHTNTILYLLLIYKTWKHTGIWKSFLQLYGVVSLALHCNEISNGTVLIYSST